MAISDEEVGAITDWFSGNFKQDSTKEMEARRALAKVLRHGPLDLSLRVWLANLFDPDMRDTEKQWFVLKQGRGRSKTVNDRKVAAVIWHRLKAGEKQEAAIQHAVDTMHVGLSTAEKALAKWRDRFDKIGPKLKGITRTTE